MPNPRKRKSDQHPPYGLPEAKYCTISGSIKKKTKLKLKSATTAKGLCVTDDSPAQNDRDREPSMEITVLSDEILIQIFSYLSTRTIVHIVGRTCKKWKHLSKDKALWRDIDMTFTRLNPATAKRLFRLYCVPGLVKSLYMRAPVRRWTDCGPGDATLPREMFWLTKCLTPGTLRKLKELGSGLERFGIEYEQIHWKIDLLSALPSQLTHLSLAYCNVGREQFQQLFLPGSQSLLKELLVLDLTGVLVFGTNIHWYHKLPPKLQSLILRDSEISLSDSGIQHLIIDHKEQLIELDLSIKHLRHEFLWKIAKQLKKLEYFNLCGTVILEQGHNIINYQLGDILYGDEWHILWGETEGVFESLKTVNLRNLTHMGRDRVAESVCMQVSFIDENGEHMLQSCKFEDNKNQTLLKDIEKKWGEWKFSPLEEKHRYFGICGQNKQGLVSQPTLYYLQPKS